MEELFCKMELLRQEMENITREIQRTGGDSMSILGSLLYNDIHQLRGRLMQIEPSSVRGHVWQNVKGSVSVNVKAK